MANAGFLFGGDTGLSYEQLQRRRKVADKLQATALGKMPKNLGEGLNTIGGAIGSKIVNKKIKGQENKQRELIAQALASKDPQGMLRSVDSPYATPSQKKVLTALLGGMPGFARGTNYAPGGRAVVGENGPEIIQLPRGSRVQPLDDMQQYKYDEMSPQMQGGTDWFMQNGMPPGTATDGSVIDPNDSMMPPQYNDARFNDAAAYQTADLAGINPENLTGANETAIQKGAFAYSSLMKGFDDYEKAFKEGGATMLPGAQKDKLDTARRGLQLQMKELFNLGVLNGPDLELMDQILVSPTSIGNNVMDKLGISDLDSRVKTNVEQVRKMMRDMIEPKLKSMNINIDELEQKEEISDDEFLKSLGLK